MNSSMMNVNVPSGYMQQMNGDVLQQKGNQLPPIGLMMSPQINPLQGRQQPQLSQLSQLSQLNHQNNGNVQISQQQAPMIREVWSNNVEQEMAMVRELIETYNYISIATEFPGIVARPIGTFRSTPDYHYQTMRSNADILKLIQLSISLTDEKGRKPEGVPSIWQFNFKFDLDSDMFSTETIDGLISGGVNFVRHKQAGIDAFEFSQLLTDSGLCLVEDVHWISYHAGYDFGFLIALLTNNQIPQEETEFFWWINKYFPNLYDVKYLASLLRSHQQQAPNLSPVKSSIENLADELGIPRFQNMLSCGYMAYLTNVCFKELQRGITDLHNYEGFIWGLGSAQSQADAAVHSSLTKVEDVPANVLQSPRGIVHYGRPM